MGVEASINSGKDSEKEPKEELVSESQTNLQTFKTNSDEKETDETDRNPELDNSLAQETCGNLSSEERTGESEPRPGGINRGINPLELPEVKEAIKKATEEAYLKGEIAGRNSRIEEVYFPTKDDGVPHFRGYVSRKPSSDIFSMAREA